MKALILLFGLFITTAASAQSYNDTIYFTSGEKRIVNVTKATTSAISYQYKRKNGNTSSGRSRKALLNGYAIYDEHQNLISRHMNEEPKQLNPTDSGEVATGVGLFVGGVTTAAVLVGGAIVFGTIVLFRWLANGGG